MKGAPLRLEIGPRDIEQNQCVLVRRDNREKTVVSLTSWKPPSRSCFKKCMRACIKSTGKSGKRTFVAHSLEEMIQVASGENGFIKTMWCGDPACEEMFKEKLAFPPAACPLSRNTWMMSALAAANPPKQWSIGEKPINLPRRNDFCPKAICFGR